MKSTDLDAKLDNTFKLAHKSGYLRGVGDAIMMVLRVLNRCKEKNLYYEAEGEILEKAVGLLNKEEER